MSECKSLSERDLRRLARQVIIAAVLDDGCRNVLDGFVRQSLPSCAAGSEEAHACLQIRLALRRLNPRH